MRYIVKIYDNAGWFYSFNSNSRDSLKHLRRNVGTLCKVFSKKGKLLSQSRYNDEYGWYRCEIDKR